MTKTRNTTAATGTLATAGDSASGPQGFRVLRGTPASVQDRGIVRLGGMSPFAARAKAASASGGHAKPRS